ncbi:MAG: PIN domain-containing protein [Gemmatimonadota bacterium]|nr:PIN domain-containing protein [Gemmatimonadota bacterium]
MFVVDTNVLVYAADRDSEHHDVCRRLLESWRSQVAPWHLSWNVIFEFLRVTTHPRVFRAPWTAREAWGFVRAVLASPGLSLLVPTERHADVASTVIGEVPGLRGNLVHDAQTAILMREHGIRQIYTRDTDFHRFPFVSPVDPVAVP